MLALVSLVLAASSGFYIFFFIYEIYKMFFSPSAGIGIIGGADGPTAIFLTSRFGMFPIAAIIGLLAGIVCMIISWILLLKKSK